MTSRVPVGDVTQEFADGGFYVKSKLETVARDILNSQYAKDEERKKAEAEAPPAALKDDDVMYLMSELEIPRSKAEDALRSTDGDVLAAAKALIGLPATGSS